MTSTSCITGTGFMKCMPMTELRPLRARGDLGDRDRARVRGEDRAGVAPARRGRRRCVNLRSRFSVAASTTSARPGHGVESTSPSSMRPRIASLSALGERSLLDLAVEILRDRVASRARARRCGDVDHRHVEARSARRRARCHCPSVPRRCTAMRSAIVAMTPRGDRARVEVCRVHAIMPERRPAAPPSGPHAPPVTQPGPASTRTVVGRLEAHAAHRGVEQHRHRPVPGEVRHPRGVQAVAARRARRRGRRRRA